MPPKSSSKVKAGITAKKSKSSLINFRLYKQANDTVLAAADSECLGKKYSSNGRVLDLIKYASFYGEETTDADGLSAHLSTCTSANLVGEMAVGVAVRMGMVIGAHVVKIGGVPHVQLYRAD